ncbi:response regulator [Sphingomonas sp. Leaf412]|uniref:response regulator n=1 Tax=Sphingomonas sp. Leaf412 TaxID=1736370 RepID=UPI0007014556|nr:response regulator [Sphingomonas sp. Leaf412]KQT32432.1 response regulator [Sphingomonas sp. Leaf412]
MLFAKKKPTLARLLLVEDEPLVAFDNEHLLTDQGYEIVATVDRVTDAVAMIVDGREIDLILADVALADGNGMDVARAALERGIPVMFVTGHCPQEAEALVIGCLDKPYTQRALIAAIGAVEAVVTGKRRGRLPEGFRLFGDAA